MKAFLALLNREYLEHRGAFVRAPLIMLAVLAAIMVLTIFTGRSPGKWMGLGSLYTGLLFQIGFAFLAWLWWLYLQLTLSIYFSESFAADRRNNSMLFWKSMPQSDFKMLLAKFVAGITILPLCVFVAVLLTGLLVLIATSGSAMMLTGAMTGGGLGRDLMAYGQLALNFFAYFGLGIAWYLPFFAYAGLLGTVMGRWAIPVGIFLPGIVVLAEFLLFGGTRHVWDFLSWRVQYGVNTQMLTAIDGPAGLTPDLLHQFLVPALDRPATLWGALFALGAVYLASEFRRRRNDN